jgi:hypothetical protein
VTPADLLQSQLRRDSARPLLTWYDDATGDRVELSVATTANWAAKTANLLADEHGLGPGDSVGLAPCAHWLSVVAVDVSDDAFDVTLPGEDTAAFMRAVLPQPDALLVSPSGADDPALVTADRSWSPADLVAAAGAPPAGARVMSTLALDTLDGLVAAVLVPLVAGGSAVLVTNADASRLADRAASERVTHTAGLDLPALFRLL